MKNPKPKFRYTNTTTAGDCMGPRGICRVFCCYRFRRTASRVEPYRRLSSQTVAESQVTP